MYISQYVRIYSNCRYSCFWYICVYFQALDYVIRDVLLNAKYTVTIETGERPLFKREFVTPACRLPDPSFHCCHYSLINDDTDSVSPPSHLGKMFNSLRTLFARGKLFIDVTMYRLSSLGHKLSCTKYRNWS